MYINLKNNRVIVTFKYDQEIVDAIKAIYGHSFNNKYKHWEFPVEMANEVVEILEPLGFTSHLEVLRVADAQKEKLNKLQNLKLNKILDESLYSGNLPLFEFQKIGANFLKISDATLLADVPGLGKSIQTLAALEGEPGPFFILCPASLKFSWAAEIQKWTDPMKINVCVINGSRTERARQWKAPLVNISPTFVIANYELLLCDYEEISKINWKAIICDEATRISNPFAKSVKALKTLRAKKKIALTGTPISNSPIDLFSIIDWLCPNYFGNYYSFLSKYCICHPKFKSKIISYKNLDDLSARVSRFMLRRTKEEVFKDFPPKTIEDIFVELSGPEKKFYTGIKKQIAEDVEKMKNSNNLGLIMVKMLRLKQATDHPALISEYKKSSKLDTLKDILDPIIVSDEKAIIFTQFAEMAKLLVEEFAPAALIIYGDVPSEERQKIVEEFNTNPHKKILIMTEAGAYGLNLQAASYVIHYDFPWSIAKLTQREDRAHRIGQNKPITVYNLIAKNTIDEYVAKTLHRKQKTSVDILDDFERLKSAGIEEEDIKNILRL